MTSRLLMNWAPTIRCLSILVWFFLIVSRCKDHLRSSTIFHKLLILRGNWRLKGILMLGDWLILVLSTVGMHEEWVLQWLLYNVIGLRTRPPEMRHWESIIFLSWKLCSFLCCIWHNNCHRSFFKVSSILRIALISMSTQEIGISLILTRLSCCCHSLTHTIYSTHLDIWISLGVNVHWSFLFHGRAWLTIVICL